jgi:hypothetical protein
MIMFGYHTKNSVFSSSSPKPPKKKSTMLSFGVLINRFLWRLSLYRILYSYGHCPCHALLIARVFVSSIRNYRSPGAFVTVKQGFCRAQRQFPSLNSLTTIMRAPPSFFGYQIFDALDPCELCLQRDDLATAVPARVVGGSFSPFGFVSSLLGFYTITIW